MISTENPFQSIFHLKVTNPGRQEYISKFDITICGAETVTNVGDVNSTSINIDALNHGESFTFDLFPMFENDNPVKCPITNIIYSLTTEIVEIDNTVKFAPGEDDV